MNWERTKNKVYHLIQRKRANEKLSKLFGHKYLSSVQSKIAITTYKSSSTKNKTKSKTQVRSKKMWMLWHEGVFFCIFAFCSKLAICEGGSFSTVIFKSDMQLSVYSFSCLFVRVSLLLKATYAENSHIVLSCRY